MKPGIWWSTLARMSCADPGKSTATVRLRVNAVGDGQFRVYVGDDGPMVGLTTYDEAIFVNEPIEIETSGSLTGWSGNHPSCTGTSNPIGLEPVHTGDISCTATFGEPGGGTLPIHSIVFHVDPGGIVNLTDEAGKTKSCDADSSPCALEVQGDNLVVVGHPEIEGQITLFQPLCPDQTGNTCGYDLAELDPSDVGEIDLSVSFGDSGTRNVLEACTGLSYTDDGPFGGAMFQVAADETCTIVPNDGAVLGTFSISGGNGFGGDDLLYVAAITEPSEWMSSGNLTDVLLNGDSLGSGRMAVPIGVDSSQLFTLVFDSGLEADIQIDGTPGAVYTVVTQTIVQISLPETP